MTLVSQTVEESGRVPAPEPLGVIHGRLIQKTLVDPKQTVSTFVGEGELFGLKVTVSGQACCRRTPSGVSGELAIAFSDVDAPFSRDDRPEVLRWRGVHRLRSAGSGGWSQVDGTGIFELGTAPAPPELHLLAAEFGTVDISLGATGDFRLLFRPLALDE